MNDIFCGYGVNYNDLADSFPPPTTGTPHTDHGSVTWQPVKKYFVHISHWITENNSRGKT